ncbi:hypothetical protein X781_7070 [Mannheimia sp. USDA-ARS-USMARC-1261]|nr:hypothetical protein X781_7070 [Mannheimia sp. USDA-ARS-USMARC-1261]
MQTINLQKFGEIRPLAIFNTYFCDLHRKIQFYFPYLL